MTNIVENNSTIHRFAHNTFGNSLNKNTCDFLKRKQINLDKVLSAVFAPDALPKLVNQQHSEVKKLKRLKFKQYIVFFVAGIFFIITMANFVIENTGIMNRSHETVEQAVMAKKALKADEVAGVLIDNSIALARYRKDSEYNYNYLFETNKGWRLIPQENTSSKVFKNINGFLVIYKTVKGKHVFNVSHVSTNELVNYSIGDSIKSVFQYNYIEYYETYVYDWLLVLDELPPNYEIVINDDVIKIN